MILSAVELGTPALKPICNPIFSRLKKEAGIHPRFRWFIINIAKCKGVQRQKLERKKFASKRFEAMKQLEEDLTKEIELLKQKLNEIDHLVKGRGLSGILNLRHGHSLEESKSARPA